MITGTPTVSTTGTRTTPPSRRAPGTGIGTRISRSPMRTNTSPTAITGTATRCTNRPAPPTEASKPLGGGGVGARVRWRARSVAGRGLDEKERVPARSTGDRVVAAVGAGVDGDDVCAVGKVVLALDGELAVTFGQHGDGA